MLNLNGLTSAQDSIAKRVKKASSHDRFDSITIATSQHVSKTSLVKSATSRTTTTTHHHNIISTSSWRVGEALVQKQLGDPKPSTHNVNTSLQQRPITAPVDSQENKAQKPSKQAGEKEIKHIDCYLIKPPSVGPDGMTRSKKKKTTTTTTSKENVSDVASKAKPKPYDKDEVRRFMERQKMQRQQVNKFIFIFFSRKSTY